MLKRSHLITTVFSLGLCLVPGLVSAADVTTNNITNGNTSPLNISASSAALLLNATGGIYLNSPAQFNSNVQVGNYSQSIYVNTQIAGSIDHRVNPSNPVALSVTRHTEANPVFRIGSDGKIYFGAGNGQSLDASLYRSAANTLQTANFNVSNALSANTVTAGSVRTDTITTGDSTNSLRITSGIAGVIISAPRDAIYLNSPTVVNASLRVGNYSQSVYPGAQIAGTIDHRVNPGNDTALKVTRHTDSNPVLMIKNDGSLNFGAGGNTSSDTNLYRPSANTLKTDDKLVAGGGLNVANSTQLTVSEGTVTVSKAYHTVNTEGGVSTDDLQTINGGTEGDILVLRAAHNDRTVVLMDGNGNLRLRGDFNLDTTEDTITLLFDGSTWVEISRSGNAA